MKCKKLNNGVDIPVLGFGVYQLDDFSLCVSQVEEALRVGYRHIDTAMGYHNEEAVGEGIRLSKIERQSIFITTKVFPSFYKEGVCEEAVLDSMRKLGIDYLDLCLIHQPFGDVYSAYRDLEKLYKKGKIRAIGVSNFKSARLLDLSLFNEVVPALNQIEINPFFQREEERAFAEGHDIATEAWAPFAEGKNSFFSNKTLLDIAEKHHRSVAQIVLRWLYERDIISLSKTSKKERLLENISIFDFSLDEDDKKKIKGMDTGKSLFSDCDDPKTVSRFHGYTIE